MNSIRPISLLLVAVGIYVTPPGYCQTAPPPPESQSNLPVSVSVFDRSRVDATQWYAATPTPETYGFTESLVRIGVAQRIKKWDWQLELAAPADIDLPTGAVSPVTAQGQLGLGGTYYASNTNNSNPAAAFLKQGFARYHLAGKDNTIGLGRFERLAGVGVVDLALESDADGEHADDGGGEQEGSDPFAEEQVAGSGNQPAGEESEGGRDAAGSVFGCEAFVAGYKGIV